MNNIKMLIYDLMNVSDGIDINKNKCIKRVWHLPLLVLFKWKV